MGGTKLFAAIGVTYTAGSVCTCSKGAELLTAQNTDGQWIFSIPETGDWTVECTDGINSSSRTVSITAEGQFEKIVMQYDLVIFADGEYQSDITMDNMNVVNGRLLLSGTSGFPQSHSSVKIDVTEYSKLVLEGEYINGDTTSNWGYRCGNFGLAANHVSQMQNNEADYAAHKHFDNVKTYTDRIEIDISKYYGEHYIAMSYDVNGGTFFWYADKIALLR